jgi:hypothetical protein
MHLTKLSFRIFSTLPPAANPAHKSWKAAQPMGVNAVSAGLREKPGTEFCTISAKAEVFENLSQNFLNLLNWEPDHSSDILTQLLIVVMCYENFVSCHETFVLCHPERSAARFIPLHH